MLQTFFFSPSLLLRKRSPEEKKCQPVLIHTQFYKNILSCIAMKIFVSVTNPATRFHSLFTPSISFPPPPSEAYGNQALNTAWEKCASASAESAVRRQRTAVLLGWHKFSFNEQMIKMHYPSVSYLAKNTLQLLIRYFFHCYFIIHIVCATL